MSSNFNKIQDAMKKAEALFQQPVNPTKQEAGQILCCADGIIKVGGLCNLTLNECLVLENGTKAMVTRLDSDEEVTALLMGHPSKACANDVVRSIGDLMVPVGKGLLGRVVNGLGEPIDDPNVPLSDVEYMPYSDDVPSITDRDSVNEPLHTGIISIDTLIPIGRGQRQLIIGDRFTGKTSIALDTIIHQSRINSDVISIYVAIGQRMSSVRSLVDTLKQHNALDNSIIFAASASDPAIVQIWTPLIACKVAGEFMRAGKNVLIIYDDLSRHAEAYREVSLLMNSPPGREAYPGDIFYLHSRLLERSAKLSKAMGGGSMTALPIIVTQAGDISGFIPTNVISITDGQLFLDNTSFKTGQRPAIDVGASVSRVGSAAQWPETKKISGDLKGLLANYRESQRFTALARDLDPVTRALHKKCAALIKMLKQPVHQTIPQEIQCLLIRAFKAGEIDFDHVESYMENFIQTIKIHGSDILSEIRSHKKLVSQDRFNEFLKTFKTKMLNQHPTVTEHHEEIEL